MPQYTIRNVPDSVDRKIRELARRRGISLNEAAIEAMRRGTGVSDDVVEHHDLDDLIGTWRPDPAFDEAVAEQDTVDTDLWR